MNEKWNIRIFKNIAASEQVHMDAIKALLDTYTPSGYRQQAMEEVNLPTRISRNSTMT